MKLPNGYGSVIRLSRRRRKPYAARVTTGWTDDGKQIRKYLGTFATRQEALNALANYNQSPFDIDLRKLTFAEVYDLWCRSKFKGNPIKPVYVAAYKNLSALHDLTFSGIRKRHIQAVIDVCPLSVPAMNHMKSVCSQMFKYAGDQEIVATNYASLVELPTKEESNLHKPFTREELSKLWKHTEDLGARVALILCYTGLRPTELAKIKTADVDLAARCMKGGIKTKAGKNRLIPGAKKIFSPVERFYLPANEYLLTVEGLTNHRHTHAPGRRRSPAENQAADFGSQLAGHHEQSLHAQNFGTTGQGNQPHSWPRPILVEILNRM